MYSELTMKALMRLQMYILNFQKEQRDLVFTMQSNVLFYLHITIY